jgi:hypothetical protein
MLWAALIDLRQAVADQRGLSAMQIRNERAGDRPMPVVADR